MDSLNKKNIPLSIEKCEFFKPKSDKNSIQRKLSKVQELIEDNELLLNSVRKASTDSTSNSKIEELPEIINFSSSNMNKNNELNHEKEMFGRDKNNLNHIYNFYQSTEEYLLEQLIENQKYKNTKNYIKKDLYNKSINNIIEENNKIENKINEDNINNLKMNTINENISNTNFIINNNNNIMPALMGTYLSKIPNPTLKGKFDMPIYYIGFYQLDSKLNFFYKKNFIYRFKSKPNI